MATSAIFELFFYKILVPARWRLVHLIYVRTPKIRGVKPKAPKHAIHWECKESKDRTERYCDVRVCNALTAGVERLLLQPFPSKDLITYIEEELEVPREVFFKAEGGWKLKTVEGK